jgi:hypothetical protein
MNASPLKTTRVDPDLDIRAIRDLAQDYRRELDRRKAQLDPQEFGWYPYGTLNNFANLDRLLSGPNRRLFRLIGEGPFLDIGAADGDTAFFLEACGFRGEVIDFPPTNFNSCRGLRLLHGALGSQVAITETDLDAEPWRPARRYDLAFFLGILYHLKNPYLVLESLARHCRHALVSTRIARFNVARGRHDPKGLNASRVELATIPVAYLVAPQETNNDPTNYWMFSEAGLRRLFDRVGFDVLDFVTLGNTRDSDPATAEGDERAFALLRSRHAG